MFYNEIMGEEEGQPQEPIHRIQRVEGSARDHIQRKVRSGKKPVIRRSYLPPIREDAARMKNLEEEQARLRQTIEELRSQMIAGINTPYPEVQIPQEPQFPVPGQTVEEYIAEVDKGKNNVERFYGYIQELFAPLILKSHLKANQSQGRDTELLEVVDYGRQFLKKTTIQSHKSGKYAYDVTEVNVGLHDGPTNKSRELSKLKIFFGPGHAQTTGGISALQFELKCNDLPIKEFIDFIAIICGVVSISDDGRESLTKVFEYDKESRKGKKRASTIQFEMGKGEMVPQVSFLDGRKKLSNYPFIPDLNGFKLPYRSSFADSEEIFPARDAERTIKVLHNLLPTDLQNLNPPPIGYQRT